MWTPLDAGGGGPTIVAAAVAAADRLALERLVGRKIGKRQRAPMRADVVGDALSERAAMQRRRSVVRDAPQRRGIVGLNECRAGRDRGAAGQEQRGETGVRARDPPPGSWYIRADSSSP